MVLVLMRRVVGMLILWYFEALMVRVQIGLRSLRL